MSDDIEYLDAKLVVYRVPDYSLEADNRGGVHSVELPGLLRIGVEIDGVFVPVTELKAGILTNSAAQARRAQNEADAQLAEQQRQAAEQQAAPQPGGEQQPGEQQQTPAQ